MGKRGTRHKRKRKTKRPRHSSKPKQVTITIPKTSRGRHKGFSKLTRVQSKKQAVYGYAITFSGRYKRTHGNTVKVRQGRGGPVTSMPMYKAERRYLRQSWGITPRKTAQKL